MIYFGGCSITMGAGYPSTTSDPRIYPNLIGTKIKQPVINEAEGGSSNLKIFTRTAKAIIDDRADIYVIQWSALHRHWLYPSPKSGFYIGSDTEGNVVDRTFVAQYQLLNHDYSNIMSLIDYVRILQFMVLKTSSKILFVNGMLPWTLDMLTGVGTSPYAQSLYQGLTSQEVLDFSSRLQNNLELLDWGAWANPWNSIIDMQQDNAPLDNHPGIHTHEKVANTIIDWLDTHQEKTQ